jgi:hypothetical protein
MPDPTLADACVPLLRGIVYADTHPRAWEALLQLGPQVRDHLQVLGLDVRVDEAEGYAYVLQADQPADEPERPRLVARRQLSYRVSLMVALLRRRLMEFDAQGDQTRLIITRDEAVELVRTFHPSGRNEARLAEEVETDLRKIIDLGFLRVLRDRPHTYEVRRVIRAFVDAQWLADFDQRLAGYLDTAAEGVR